MVEGRIEVIGKRRRRSRQLSDDLEETEVEIVRAHRTLPRTGFARGNGLVVGQTTD